MRWFWAVFRSGDCCLIYVHSKTITWWKKWLTTITSHDSFNFPIYSYDISITCVQCMHYTYVYIYIYIYIYECMNVWLMKCMNVCMNVLMKCMNVCMKVCINEMYAWMYGPRWRSTGRRSAAGGSAPGPSGDAVIWCTVICYNMTSCVLNKLCTCIIIIYNTYVYVCVYVLLYVCCLQRIHPETIC